MAVTLEICWPAMTVHLLSTLANRPCLRFILTGLMQCGFECSMGLLGLFHINSWHWIFLKLFCPSFHAGMNGTGQGKSRSHCNILLPWARSLTVKACCRLEPAAALWQEAEQHQAKRLIHLTELDNFTLSFARSSMCRRLFPKPALPSKKPPDTQTSFTHAQFASTAASSPTMCTMPEVTVHGQHSLCSFPDATAVIPAVGSINLSPSVLLLFPLTYLQRVLAVTWWCYTDGSQLPGN